jgi:hypothetical protein
MIWVAHPGSRGQKATRSRIRIRNTETFLNEDPRVQTTWVGVACLGGAATASRRPLGGEHPLLLLHIAADDVMQEEECLGVHRDEDVILELCDEGADHGGAGVVGCRRSLALDVIRLPREFDALRHNNF